MRGCAKMGSSSRVASMPCWGGRPKLRSYERATKRTQSKPMQNRDFRPEMGKMVVGDAAPVTKRTHCGEEGVHHEAAKSTKRFSNSTRDSRGLGVSPELFLFDEMRS